MSLQELLLLVAAWCGTDSGTAGWGSSNKFLCQTRMTKCLSEELKKNEPKLEPVFLRCWDKVMR